MMVPSRENMNMKAKIIFCIFGLFAIIFGIYRLFHHFWLKKTCTVQVRGDVSFIPYKPGSEMKKQLLSFLRFIAKITGMEEEAAKLGTIDAYYEVITYSVNDVERVVPTGHRDVENVRYSTGQNVVTVAYDPSNPDRYIVLEQEGTIALGVMCVVLGAVFSITPLILNPD